MTKIIAPKDTKSKLKTSLANEDTNIKSEKEIPGTFNFGNKATIEVYSDVSCRFNSCAQSNALLFSYMLINSLDIF